MPTDGGLSGTGIPIKLMTAPIWQRQRRSRRLNRSRYAATTPTEAVWLRGEAVFALRNAITWPPSGR